MQLKLVAKVTYEQKWWWIEEIHHYHSSRWDQKDEQWEWKSTVSLALTSMTFIMVHREIDKNSHRSYTYRLQHFSVVRVWSMCVQFLFYCLLLLLLISLWCLFLWICLQTVQTSTLCVFSFTLVRTSTYLHIRNSVGANTICIAFVKLSRVKTVAYDRSTFRMNTFWSHSQYFFYNNLFILF